MSALPQTQQVREHPSGDDASAGSRGIRRQALFRDVNEEIRRIAERFAVDEALQLVCECGQGDCSARLSVSAEEYEAVRRFPTRFVTRADHLCEDERVVKEFGACVVVEKIGDGAQSAILLDPRRHATPRGRSC